MQLQWQRQWCNGATMVGCPATRPRQPRAAEPGYEVRGAHAPSPPVEPAAIRASRNWVGGGTPPTTPGFAGALTRAAGAAVKTNAPRPWGRWRNGGQTRGGERSEHRGGTAQCRVREAGADPTNGPPPWRGQRPEGGHSQCRWRAVLGALEQKVALCDTRGDPLAGGRPRVCGVLAARTHNDPFCFGAGSPGGQRAGDVTGVATAAGRFSLGAVAIPGAAPAGPPHRQTGLYSGRAVRGRRDARPAAAGGVPDMIRAGDEEDGDVHGEAR